MTGINSADTLKKLRSFVEAGFHIQEIADEMGLSYNAVRSRLYRAGVRATPKTSRSIRLRAESMKPADAVDYLLNCVEMLSPNPEGHAVDDWGVKFTAQERRVVIALVEARGLVVSKYDLLDAASFGSEKDAPMDGLVNVLILKIRRKLPKRIGTIENVWGRGYRFVRTEA